jgi:hypothetical protein
MAEIFPCRNSPSGSGLPQYRGVTITLTVSYTPHSVGPPISPSQRPLPDNTKHSQEADSLPSVGIEQAMPASERPQTHALDRAATGINI